MRPRKTLAVRRALAAAAAALGAGRGRRARTRADLDRLFVLSTDLVAIADFDGRFIRVNPAVERILGYTPEEFLARPYEELVHPEDIERTAAEIGSITAGRTTVSFENRYRRKDGAYRILEWKATPVVEDGLMYGVGRDVTERRRIDAVQTALRRVATLVAREASQGEVVAAIADELQWLLGTEEFRIVRYDEEGTAAVVASTGALAARFGVGSRLPLGGHNATSLVAGTGRPARIDDQSTLSGMIGAEMRAIGIRSVVGTPITVEGCLWGAMIAGTTRGEPLPADTEARLGAFTELMASAIANTESHARAERLAAEQAALGRVATLVASGCAPDEILAAVGDEVRAVVGNELTSMFRCEPGDILTLVAVRARGPVPDGLVGKRLPMRGSFAAFLEAGRPVLLDEEATAQWMTDLPEAAPLALRSAIGVPIIVGGRPWGAIFVCDTKADGLPREVEKPFVQFTELVATAIANAQARSELRMLAEEQAALRRVATLVAEDVAPEELFTAVAREAGTLLGGDLSGLGRFEGGDVIAVGVWAADGRHPRYAPRWHMLENDPASTVAATGQAVRRDDWSEATGFVAKLFHKAGMRSSVATPVVVEGTLWGALALHSRRPAAFGADTETRMRQFTDLLGTALANAHARGELARLAHEQASLRRVATLVAEGAPPAAVFDAVTAEMLAVLGADDVTLGRHEPDGGVSVVAHRGSGPAKDDRPPVTVSAPIVLEGRPWGVLTASWRGDDPLPVDTEARMAEFAELLDTAIANADSREQLTVSRARLLSEADDARRKVVRDLHDGAQQRLVHTILSLKLAQRALREGDGSAHSVLDEALASAEQSNRELRELAHGILPTVLTSGGLRSGVESLVERLDHRVDVDVTGERFAAEIEASAYFIVAEALTNVVKHAGARRAAVRASVRSGALRVEIADDGAGGADLSGHGLVGMSDRVSALGGRLSIDSPVGRGTVVVASLPLICGPDRAIAAAS